MPGRDDFGKIQSKLFSDERAHRAAAAYSAQLAVPEDLALATVVGHVAMLAVYVARETDDGILEGSGHAAFRTATMSPASVTRVAVAILLDVGLLRTVENGTYVCGFAECYGGLVGRRTKAKERMSVARSANMTRTCAERAQNVQRTCSERAIPEERRGEREENPSPTPSGDRGNNEAQNPKPLGPKGERWFGEHRFGPHSPLVSATLAELDARKPRLSRDDFVRISNDEKETELIRAAASKAVFIRDQRSSW